MMVFGKKCPACGGVRLIARPPVSRIATLPTARSYACADCQQQLIFLFPFSIGVENRHFARKQLPSFFLVRIPGGTNQYARIKNISEGGLCFDQHYNAAPISHRFFKLDLYNCNDGASLEQLPAEIVATSEQLLEVNGIKSTILNNSARFIDLNQAQIKVLRTCLTQYGI
ncbi:PilZ domain-containing protein [uncultured Desulfobulbus sp.]|uniref:PilZ domain-containing protein n=1 Tax=uncultured Desulfobulbus sp. TaxID=239745 RepID=UPI0029C99C4C|nr:PilZ domain-containing protein [uncultured Desulfobulbus sp.]